MNRIKGLLFTLILIIGNDINAQIEKHAFWAFNMTPPTPIVGDTVVLGFNATIDKDWYIYSNDFDSLLGPMLTEFHFQNNASFSLVGSPIAQNPSKAYDSIIWQGEYTYFKGKGSFKQKAIINSNDFSIEGLIIYQVCSDLNGKCINDEEGFLFSSIEPSMKAKPSIKNSGIEQNDDLSFWTIFIVSFIAGITAVLMPCVYPLIPVTVSIFIKQSGTKSQGVKKAAFYGLSIIILFSIIGFLVSLLFGFSSLNALSTNWVFNVALFLLLFVFGLSFLGLFELNLPSSFVTKIDEQADRGGYIGIFFMAATLVVVSFSCTVPIVSSAIISFLDGSLLSGTLSLFAFSLAFAIPFTLFAAFPSFLKKMPKSGDWMTTLKRVLGFLELAFALKFLSIADLAYHWNILDRHIFLAIWIVIFLILGLYLLGKIKLEDDRKEGSIPVGRVLLSIIVLSFATYLIPGLFGAPLKPLSGLLPPMTTQDFKLGASTNSSIYVKEKLCTHPKYSDFLQFPHNLQGYFDLAQAIECAKNENKPIFVDFTGHGCANCRWMEEYVWSDTRVLEKLKKDFILLALYVDDKTKLPESDWIVGEHDGKTRKTIGGINANYQRTEFNNNAQPFYLILDKNGNQIADPIGVVSVEEFLVFLDITGS